MSGIDILCWPYYWNINLHHSLWYKSVLFNMYVISLFISRHIFSKIAPSENLIFRPSIYYKQSLQTNFRAIILVHAIISTQENFSPKCRTVFSDNIPAVCCTLWSPSSIVMTKISENKAQYHLPLFPHPWRKLCLLWENLHAKYRHVARCRKVN